MKEKKANNVLIVTGPSGAGKTTAINVLADMGFETIDNIPIELIDRVMAGPDLVRPLALGIDVRTRGFSAPNLIKAIGSWIKNSSVSVSLLYLDCRRDVLERRFNETRRRHPLSDGQNLRIAIIKEGEVIDLLSQRADFLVDTSKLNPNGLKRQLIKLFDNQSEKNINITLQSFSYKRSVPPGIDMLLDCRFLKNPYWDKNMREKNGKNKCVGAFIQKDDNWTPFFEKTLDLLAFLLPKYRQEGKTYFSIGFGCSGGQHRSVFACEEVSRALANQGWIVNTDHRELNLDTRDVDKGIQESKH